MVRDAGHWQLLAMARCRQCHLPADWSYCVSARMIYGFNVDVISEA
jgi:hypothetical protein